MKPSFLAVALCLFIGLVGCNTQTKTPVEDKPRTNTPATPMAVELKVTKLPEFLDFVKTHKGKIVVIDFWSTGCIPCMKAFPHHVELHEKYRDKGVVCMSVSLDLLEDKESALKFLQKKNAAFPNFLISEKPTVWQDHYGFSPIPATMVYDAKGELRKFTNDDPDNGFTTEDVEKLVQKLLKG